MTDPYIALIEPLLMALPAIDPYFPTEGRRKGIDIMEKDGKKYHLQEYQGVEHGFGLRCDLEKPYERKPSAIHLET
jgi:dienelactone hydrolase